MGMAWGTFQQQGFTQIRLWTNNYVNGSVWDAITHPYQNFDCGLGKPPLKLGYGWVITPPFYVYVITYVGRSRRCSSSLLVTVLCANEGRPTMLTYGGIKDQSMLIVPRRCK